MTTVPQDQPVKTRRRQGTETSEIRARLISAAALILRTDGASAVTASRLAREVGLQRHIVHYYFGTIEDLFVAVLERDSARAGVWIAEALETRDPVDVIWDLGSTAAAVTLDFFALANRHASVRAAFRRQSEDFRRYLAMALERHLEMQGIAPQIPAPAITLILQSIAYTLSIEHLLGMAEGHAQMRASLDHVIAMLIKPLPAQGG